MAETSRVVILVDMDCFYCQVEENLNPDLKGKPIAVVQYNEWRGGGIIAVNYPARDRGVTRHMRGEDAKQKCPEIILAKVPQVRGKADLSKYREAGKRVAEVLKTYTTLLERASVDEAYLDITGLVRKRTKEDFGRVQAENLQNTFVVGCDTSDFLSNVHQNGMYSESDCMLAMGGLIAEEIRADVYAKTGYRCSAGIAHNKILAKLVCGMHKPNKQTILPQESVPELYKNLPVRKIKSLGGKFGNFLSEELKITNMGELIQFSEKDLHKKFDEKTAKWLFNIARGIDLEPVTTRLISKSIGCCKRFPGRTALLNLKDVDHWIKELADEMSERLQQDLEENNRRAKQTIISFTHENDRKSISSSRTQLLTSYETDKIARIAWDVVKKFCEKPDGTFHVTFLGISASNFESNKNKEGIASFFKNMSNKNAENNVKAKNSGEFCNEIKNIEENLTVNDKNIKLEESNKKKEGIMGFFENMSKKIVENEVKEKNSEEFCIEFENIKENPRAENIDLKLVEENKISLEESLNDSKDSDVENNSVYSATTEELFEDQQSLIYYEDIFPESNLKQPIFRDTNESHQENIPEAKNLNNLKDSATTERSSSLNSFFHKYFEENFTNIDNSPKSSPELEEKPMEIFTEKANDDLKKLEEKSNPNENLNNFLNDIESQVQNKTSPILTSNFNLNFIVNCPECDRKLPQSELESHLDYHFALKIVKDEAHLYKQPIATKNSSSPKTSKDKQKLSRGAKRKAKNEVESCSKSLTFFLKKDEDLNETNSELCGECNKRIKLDDISGHIDYHAAKKLHLELNFKSETEKNALQNNVSSKLVENKRKNGSSSKSIKDISSFFKPL